MACDRTRGQPHARGGPLQSGPGGGAKELVVGRAVSLLTIVATAGTRRAGEPYTDMGRGRGPSGHSGCPYVGGAGRNTGCAQGQPEGALPPDRGKSDGNKIIISSGSHDRSPTRWRAPYELGPGTSSRTGRRRTTVQGREGCKRGPRQGRAPALWTCSLRCPQSPTESPLCCPSSPSLLLFHSDQVPSEGDSVRGGGAPPPARGVVGPGPRGGHRQEDCIRPVSRLPASDFPCRDRRQSWHAQAHRRTGAHTHTHAHADRDRDREPDR